MGVFDEFVQDLIADRKQNSTKDFILQQKRAEFEQSISDRQSLIGIDRERVQAAEVKRILNEPFELGGAL
jgi:hypothetical protein